MLWFLASDLNKSNFEENLAKVKHSKQLMRWTWMFRRVANICTLEPWLMDVHVNRPMTVPGSKCCSHSGNGLGIWTSISNLDEFSLHKSTIGSTDGRGPDGPTGHHTTAHQLLWLFLNFLRWERCYSLHRTERTSQKVFVLERNALTRWSPPFGRFRARQLISIIYTSSSLYQTVPLPLWRPCQDEIHINANVELKFYASMFCVTWSGSL